MAASAMLACSVNGLSSALALKHRGWRDANMAIKWNTALAKSAYNASVFSADNQWRRRNSMANLGGGFSIILPGSGGSWLAVFGGEANRSNQSAGC